MTVAVILVTVAMTAVTVAVTVMTVAVTFVTVAVAVLAVVIMTSVAHRAIEEAVAVAVTCGGHSAVRSATTWGPTDRLLLLLLLLLSLPANCCTSISSVRVSMSSVLEDKHSH